MNTIINTNKKNIQAMKAALRKAQADAYEQEQSMLIAAAEMTAGKGMTAREVSAALDGQLSVQEVAQNFRFIGGEGWKTSRYIKFGSMPGRMSAKCAQVARHFVEVDASGAVLTGEVITRKEIRTVYTYAPNKGR